MLHPERWFVAGACLLVWASVLFAALPRAEAAPLGAREHLASARQAISANGICPYSETRTVVIIDSEKWTTTAFFCGTGFLKHAIARANDIYDNGGGPMWVKWADSHQEHFCSISGMGAYWTFSRPVTITQIYYGENHSSSYCP